MASSLPVVVLLCFRLISGVFRMTDSNLVVLLGPGEPRVLFHHHLLGSKKADLKTKTMRRDKKGHYIIIKGTIQQEDITIVNIYTPYIGAPKYIKQL